MKKYTIMFINHPVLFALVLILAGVLLILHPGVTLIVAVRILGAAVLLWGVFRLILCFMSKDEETWSYFQRRRDAWL